MVVRFLNIKIKYPRSSLPARTIAIPDFEQPCWDVKIENMNGAISIFNKPLIHHDETECKDQ